MSAPSAVLSESTPLSDAASKDKVKRVKSRAEMSSYGLVSKEVEKDEGVSKVYDVNTLITWKVFGIASGTVLHSSTLWKETAMMALVYWFVFGPSYIWRWKGFSEFVGKESTIRAFIAMFSTLIGLLLSFYTALNLGRWWQMRMAVQAIQEGSKKLTMMVSQGVTQDKVLLQTINRYARASLYLIFQASQMEPGEDAPVIKAVKRGFLTQEEADNLQKLNPHMAFVQAETLWVWLGNVVTRLHDQGLTKGAPHYCLLIATVDQGRSGICDVQTFLETPIPLGYVHLLCLMVKLHNLILTVLMAMTAVMHAGGQHGFDIVGVFRVSVRAFFMPFLYNALLVLNAEVTDPFGGDDGDFSWSNFDSNLAMSGKSYAKASNHLPESLKAHFLPIKSEQGP